MNRTPEEIKKGLECCSQNLPYPCSGCPYERDEQQENAWRCDLDADALAYIQQLEDGIDRVYELAKGLRLQISQLESQLAAPYKQATMKEAAEYLKRMGIDCCYGKEEHD